MGTNIERLTDLSIGRQEDLLSYIRQNFTYRTTINTKASEYGLKQKFTRLFPSKSEHITTQCFKEAMEYEGYSSKPVKGHISNWHFNVKVLRR